MREKQVLMRKNQPADPIVLCHLERLLKFRVLQIWNIDSEDLKLRNTGTAKIKIPLDLHPLV